MQSIPAATAALNSLSESSTTTVSPLLALNSSSSVKYGSG
jgi:hypothetical protein